MVDLDTITQEIFVDSFKVVSFQNRTWYLSPFNADKVSKEVKVEVKKDYQKRVPYYDDSLSVLDDLSATIKETGKITKEIYDKYGSILNAIGRRLTSTSGSLYGKDIGPDNYDRESVEIGDEFRRMPDRESRESIGCPNIYHSNSKEGTLFQRDYQRDSLTQFRIFHQLHRANLIVKTVDIDLLVEEVDKIIKERDAKTEPNLSLPYDEETFAYEKVEEFNEAFGEYVTLNICSIGNNHNSPTFIVEFKQSRRELLEIFSNLDIPLSIYSDDIRLTLRKEGELGNPLDFYDRSVIDRNEPQQFRLDTTNDDVQTYLLLRNKVPEFCVPLLKDYIKSRI